MPSVVTGQVFNIQRFSIHDGPGVRTTVFLKGCPADCWWCHNPEARAATAELSIDVDSCLHCGACLEACAHGAAKLDAEGPRSDGEVCVRCGACVAACATTARKLVGKGMTVEELLLEVGRDAVFYQESAGGVTFSGGEPLMQAEFVMAALAAAKEHGYHAAVDTCGAVDTKRLLAAAAVADLFLYDLKLIDDERHRRFVGISNRLVLANLRALAACKVDVWLRMPLIPGINDDPENLKHLARFVNSLPRRLPLYLLPYHAMAAEKYRRLGRSSRLADVEPPHRDAVDTVAEQLRDYNLEVYVGAGMSPREGSDRGELTA